MEVVVAIAHEIVGVVPECYFLLLLGHLDIISLLLGVFRAATVPHKAALSNTL